MNYLDTNEIHPHVQIDLAAGVDFRVDLSMQRSELQEAGAVKDLLISFNAISESIVLQRMQPWFNT